MNERELQPDVDEIELDDPDVITIFQIIKTTIVKLKDKTAIILWSSFILLTLWGFEGEAKLVFPSAWRKALFPNIAWRDQLVTFLTGFVLVVVIPCLIIKFFFREKLRDYGLGWPRDRIKLGIVAMLVTIVIALPLFYIGTKDASMQKEYPLFRGAIPADHWGAFILYEAVYFLFFVCIEFIFRGYLLFGLYGIEEVKALREKRQPRRRMVFGIYAVLIQMLAYIMWHIGKPDPEYIGAIFWGVAVAAVALKLRSIWPIIIVHWLLNVFVDLVLWIKPVA